VILDGGRIQVTDRARAADWVGRYLRAWESNDPTDIAALFADDAIYRPTPQSDGWRGRDAIVREWLGRKDDPGGWEFEHEVLAVDGDLAVVRGVTRYKPPSDTYENLWLIRIGEDGRAREFVEYWMAHEKAGDSGGSREQGSG
jgi:ketosteroid isomerase-like protein